MFEFDLEKSITNKEKHGIDFLEAQELWNDSRLLTVSARTEDEQRFLAIGRIENRIWSAVITYRDDTIRLISVRRSRKEEIALYES